MKKFLLLPCIVPMLVACSQEPTTEPRAIYIQSEIQNAGPESLVSTGYFWAKDKMYKLPANADLVKLYNQYNKDSKFLTASVKQDMFQNGYCLVNETRHDYRIFCGTWQEYHSISTKQMYAVSIPKAQNAYDYVQSQIGDDVVVIAHGSFDDFIIKVPETKKLKEIASHKTTQFLSVANSKKYIEDGYCLVNIIPYNTMKKLGTPNDTCRYRLFCGSASDMNYEKEYAAELCDSHKFITVASQTSIEECIDEICERVMWDGTSLYVQTTLNVHSKYDDNVFTSNHYRVPIPAEEAIKISKNWDYNNMKFYTNNDLGLFEYEVDACDALYRLNEYLDVNGLQSVQKF